MAFPMYSVPLIRIAPRLANASVGRLRLVAAVPPARFNSTRAPPSDWSDKQARKEALDKIHDLQRDWDACILTYEELKPKTQSPTQDLYLIDVREPGEVIQGMIPSAVNLPLSTLADSLHLSKLAFKAKHGFEKPKPDQEVIFYCRSGMRSSSASDIAKRNGYTNIYNYKGSWLEWVSKEIGRN